MAFIFFLLSAIALGIGTFAATAIGRVRLLSLGLFLMAVGFALTYWGYPHPLAR